jgi:hypothetical protein
MHAHRHVRAFVRLLRRPGRSESRSARTGGKPTLGPAQPVGLWVASSAFFVEGAGAPAGEGDRIDASAGEFLEAARQWAPAEVGLRFPLLLHPAADVIADLELYERAQRRPGVVHVRKVAAKGWCTVHQYSSPRDVVVHGAPVLLAGRARLRDGDSDPSSGGGQPSGGHLVRRCGAR